MSNKKLRLSLLSLLGLALSLGQLSGSITINVTAEKLKDPGGIDMAVTGVLALVADTGTEGFSGPSGTLLEGDDYLVGAWDIASGGGNAPGSFLGTTGAVALSGDWAQDDPLAVYFFPTLALTDPPASAEAVPYGMFRIESGTPDGTDPWVTPEDGTLAHDLVFATTDATTLFPGGGSSSADDGIAGLVTPGTAPVAPTGVAGVADGPGKIIVSWTTDASSDEDGFRVERKSGASGVWEVVGEVGVGVSVFDDTTGIESGAAYFYRVLATRGPSYSLYSDESAEVTSSAATARFTNLSTRALVGTGDEILIASFEVKGGPLRIYARVAGPDLEAAGIPNFLADPTMQLFKIGNNTPIKENDNWRDDEAELVAITDINFQPAFEVDPALVANLTEDGLYSVVVRGVGDTTGFANVEVYEFADPAEPNSGKLTNLSVRAAVGTGDEILIASFQVTGEVPQRIYSRVAGPDLEAAGIPNFLADPTMELREPNVDPEIAANDNWRDDEAELAAITAINFQPAFEVDPALIATVPGGGKLYSVVVRGVGDTTGFANVELYDFPE